MIRDKSKFNRDIQNHHSPVDIDALWKAIEPEVDLINEHRRKKRDQLLYFYFLGVLLLGGTYFFFASSQSLSKTTLAERDSRFSNSHTSISEEKSNSKSIPQVSTISTNNIPQFSLKPQKDVLVSNPNEEPIPKSISTLSNKPLAFDSNTKTALTPTPFRITETQSYDENPEFVSPKPPVVDEKNQDQSALDMATIQQKSHTSLASLNSLNWEIPASDYDLVFSKIKPYSEKAPRKRTKDGFALSLEASSGLAFAAPILRAKTPAAEGLLQRRRATEFSLETVQQGAQLELRHTSGWAFASGVTRTRIAERYESTDRQIETEMIWGLKSVRIDVNGDSISNYGEIPYSRTTIVNQKVYNSYTLIDLPLLLGYYHQWNDWEVGLQAGVWANISLKTKGKISHSETDLIDLEAAQNQLFKTRLGWSYHLGASIQRPMGNHWAFGFSPYVHYYSNDFSLDSYGISQKYLLFGGKLGIYYRLGQ